jgi:hypothetical protein
MRFSVWLHLKRQKRKSGAHRREKAPTLSLNALRFYCAFCRLTDNPLAPIGNHLPQSLNRSVLKEHFGCTLALLTLEAWRHARDLGRDFMRLSELANPLSD